MGYTVLTLNTIACEGHSLFVNISDYNEDFIRTSTYYDSHNGKTTFIYSQTIQSNSFHLITDYFL
ncbi:MAG: hypothetical protein ACFFAU_12875, partial [Candidatus Hodarchaeota archaeon]